MPEEDVSPSLAVEDFARLHGLALSVDELHGHFTFWRTALSS
jgi:hypothetical protein